MDRYCSKCRAIRPLADFHKKPRTWCAPCSRAANNAAYHNQCETRREKHRAASRRSQLKKYGLTLEMFIALFEKQQGRCAICPTAIYETHEDRYMTACVDHCHETGVVRGLLCWDCNVGLGKFKDETERLRAAITYLEDSRRC